MSRKRSKRRGRQETPVWRQVAGNARLWIATAWVAAVGGAAYGLSAIEPTARQLSDTPSYIEWVDPPWTTWDADGTWAMEFDHLKADLEYYMDRDIYNVSCASIGQMLSDSPWIDEVISVRKTRRGAVEVKPLDEKLSFREACLKLPVMKTRTIAMAQIVRKPWAIQVAGNFRHAAAVNQWERMRRQVGGTVASAHIYVSRVRSPMGRRGIYAVRIGADSRGEADRICSQLRSRGGFTRISSSPCSPASASTATSSARARTAARRPSSRAACSPTPSSASAAASASTRAKARQPARRLR